MHETDQNSTNEIKGLLELLIKMAGSTQMCPSPPMIYSEGHIFVDFVEITHWRHLSRLDL